MDTERERGSQADLLAATLNDGLRESQDLLGFLALKFEDPLGSLVSVRRKGGLLSKKRTVEEITFQFDGRHFQMTRDPRGLVAPKIMKVVRGIVVKTSTVAVEEWIGELVLELSLQAERSAALRSALSQFILG